MLFSVKLKERIYKPWEENYIKYDYLKTLLKEAVIGENEWTEHDELQFVEELNDELEKVYSFETAKYSEISNQIKELEAEVQKFKGTTDDAVRLNKEVDELLTAATELDRFRRLNYTGFTKIVKKHDRLHSKYQVRPLLHVRLKSLPFHSEDYSPLLYRLSTICRFLKDNYDASSSTKQMQVTLPTNYENHSSGYVTRQYWVHPENVMEVKTRVLRKLPVLVYNQGDDEDINSDPTVTSLYMDNASFELYQSQLEKQQNDKIPTSLRFRWYGHLYERPEIVLEQHNEEDGRITRISLKEKTINAFLSGDHSVIEKQIQKMKAKQVPARVIQDYKEAAEELQSFIVSHKIEPLLRTIYVRSAFEMPGDDSVRVILDSDILFICEDSLNKKRPIRDPSSWRRNDLDAPNVNLMSILRKGEFARFPYSVLEVRFKRQPDDQNLPTVSWIQDLLSSKLIREVPHFSKFLHGTAVLYGEDDFLESLPFWLNDMDMTINDQNRMPNYVQGNVQDSSKNFRLTGDANLPVASYNLEPYEDFDESDESDVVPKPASSSVPEIRSEIGYPTWSGPPKLDQDSEDEEVVLPMGVSKPKRWIKNQSAVKVEAKVWLANERTFNRWLGVACLLSALTFTLYSSVSASVSPGVATVVAIMLFGLTIFSAVWGYYQYMHRLKLIRDRTDKHFDNSIGPLIVAFGLLIALVINFLANIYHRDADLRTVKDVFVKVFRMPL